MVLMKPDVYALYCLLPLNVPFSPAAVSTHVPETCPVRVIVPEKVAPVATTPIIAIPLLPTVPVTAAVLLSLFTAVPVILPKESMTTVHVPEASPEKVPL